MRETIACKCIYLFNGNNAANGCFYNIKNWGKYLENVFTTGKINNAMEGGKQKMPDFLTLQVSRYFAIIGNWRHNGNNHQYWQNVVYTQKC